MGRTMYGKYGTAIGRTTVREYVEDIRVCTHTKSVELDRVRDPENDEVELR